MANPEVIKTILSETLAAATSIVARFPQEIPGWVKGITLEANFVRAGGGTSAKAYVQTSFDNVNWTDIACFAFTTSSLRKIVNLTAGTPVTTQATPTDGSLTDNTAIDGIIGSFIQTKIVTTGTYSGASSFTVTAKLQS